MNTVVIELDDAIERLVPLAKEHEDRMAVQTIKESIAGLRLELADMTRQAETYRHMYEGIQKRLERYRDVASRPDIPENVMADKKISEENTETTNEEAK